MTQTVTPIYMSRQNVYLGDWNVIELTNFAFFRWEIFMQTITWIHVIDPS